MSKFNDVDPTQKNKVWEIAYKRKEIAKERAEMKERLKNLQNEYNEYRNDIIVSLFDKFREKMELSSNRADYINGRYSDEFTRHINRNISFSARHYNAINNYNIALRNLNTVFLDEVITNTEKVRKDLATFAGLKNLSI